MDKLLHLLHRGHITRLNRTLYIRVTKGFYRDNDRTLYIRGYKGVIWG